MRPKRLRKRSKKRRRRKSPSRRKSRKRKCSLPRARNSQTLTTRPPNCLASSAWEIKARNRKSFSPSLPQRRQSGSEVGFRVRVR